MRTTWQYPRKRYTTGAKTKVCSDCGKRKSIRTSFYLNTNGAPFKRCKVCQTAFRKAHYKSQAKPPKKPHYKPQPPTRTGPLQWLVGSIPVETHDLMGEELVTSGPRHWIGKSIVTLRSAGHVVKPQDQHHDAKKAEGEAHGHSEALQEPDHCCGLSPQSCAVASHSIVQRGGHSSLLEPV